MEFLTPVWLSGAAVSPEVESSLAPELLLLISELVEALMRSRRRKREMRRGARSASPVSVVAAVDGIALSDCGGVLCSLD